MTQKHILLTCLLALGASTLSHAEINLRETRTTLQEWVETQRLTSEERNRWRLDRELIQEQIILLRTDLENLEVRILESEEATTVADVAREALGSENETLRSASSIVGDALPAMENRLRDLRQFFPPVLRNRPGIETLFSRMPRPDQARAAAIAGISLSMRVQNVVGIMSEVENFNRQIIMTREIQEVRDGERAEVKTLYFGLGVAYFSNQAGDYAGMLVPARGEWRKVPVEPTEGRAIARAIAIFERDQLAAFTLLPVEVQDLF